MFDWLPNMFARIDARIGFKLSVALFSLVGLFVVLGAVGIGALRDSDRRTQSLIELQRKIAAYQALQSNTTALRFIVSNAFLENSKHDLDTARRQIGQIAYDFNRAEFISADDREKVEAIKDDYAQLVEIGYEVLGLLVAGQTEVAQANQMRRATRLGDDIERLTYALIASAQADMIQKAAQGRKAYQVSRYTLIATAVVSVLIAIVVGYALSGTIVRPLERTNTRLAQISSGDFSGKLTVENRDELGELAVNVNRMSTELETLYEKLERASEHKTEFLARMSHEIRTPMNAILGMAELMLDTHLSREQRDYVQTSHDSGKALVAIIDDILDFSKIEAGELELEYAPFDLRDCVESTLDMIAYVVSDKDLDLAYRIHDGTPEAVMGDVTRLRQILINLLNNAVKFTEQGEVAIDISYVADSSPQSGAYHFEVRDTGIGIPEDRIDRLFQSFRQVDASTRRRYGGTGLGLAISKRLIELMNGEIGVTSTVGVGTTFAFNVRLGLQEAVQDQTIGGFELTNKAMLILCDGGSTTCEELKRYISKWGIQTTVVETAQDAVNLLNSDTYIDVFVVDADHYSEAEADLEKLKGAAQSTPGIAMVRRGHSARQFGGFTAFVQKPFKPSVLYNTLIETLLGDGPEPKKLRPVASALDPELAQRCPLRILLTDDHPTNRKIATQVLSRLGYRIDTATNAIEALERLEEKTYDLVLMDIHMPEMDGRDATLEVRRRFPSGWPRVVMMTANVMQRDWLACQAAGAVDIVRKPIEIPKLIAVLEECHAALAGKGGSPDRPAAQAERPKAHCEKIGTNGRQAHHLIDTSAIRRLMDLIGGDPALFDELLKSFCKEAPKLFAELEAGAAGDPERLRLAAHTVKSSAADFGATKLAAQCAELEKIGDLGGTEDAIKLVRKAATEWSAVEAELAIVSKQIRDGGMS